MNNLRREWSKEEIEKLNYDIKVSKIKVFIKWGFSVTEISKIMELPEPIIQTMINE